MEAVALDVGGIMAPTFVVPDTSGLAPLALPESFLGRHDTPQPYPDAVRRFEAAMGDAAQQAAARAFCASLAVADMPQQAVSQDGSPVAAAADKPVAASSDPSLSGQAPLRDAGGTQFIVSETKGTSQLPPDGAVSGKPESVVADRSVTVGVERQPVVVAADKPVGQLQNPVAASSAPPVSGQAPLQDAGVTQLVASESQGASQLPPEAAVSGKPETVVADKSLPVVDDKPVAVAADKPVVQPQNPVVASSDPPVSGKNVLQDSEGKQFIASAVAAVSAASARTEAIADTVNQIVEAVVGQMVVTPSLVRGEGEVRMTLKPTVLDGSDITLTAKDGTLTVAVTPATSASAQAAAVALPQLETALAEHAPAFRHVAVALVAKKGKIDETA